MIHLEWYRIFMETARHGNFTKAAQSLHITQPSVSYAIRQLEESLGLQLFRRLSKGVELTEEGRVLLRYVEKSLALLESAQKHVSGMKRLEAGEIRIGAGDSLIKHLLLPHLNLFHRQYPGIRIQLSHGKTPEIAKRLVEGMIDCAIVHMPVHDPQLEVRTLAAVQHCFVVGESYRGYADRELTPKELIELPLVLGSPGSSTRGFAEQWFAASGLTAKPDIELGNIDLIAEFAVQGYGAAFINRSFVQKELRDGRLFELRLTEELPVRNIGFAVRRGAKLSLAADRFARLLLEQSLPGH